MPRKQKIEKLKRPSKSSIRRRFEERFLTLYGGANPELRKQEMLIKNRGGHYAHPHVRSQWEGFLLAYDHGPDALPMQEASPFVTRITRDMRALALERQTSDPRDETARLLDGWADEIEARPDALYEDVYEQLVDMIEAQVHRGGPSSGHPLYPFPPSVVDTVGILLDHFNKTRPGRDITPGQPDTPTVENNSGALPQLQDLR